MRKSDLRPGMVVEVNLTNLSGWLVSDESKIGRFMFCSEDHYAGEKAKFIRLDKTGEKNTEMRRYEDLTDRLTFDHTFYEEKIVKIYEDYTCTKVLWERKERPVLTKDEKVILRNIDPMYKYIARDITSLVTGGLHVYFNKPCKNAANVWATNNAYSSLQVYNHMFDFIKCDDKEPYSIKYLLGESEVNE